MKGVVWSMVIVLVVRLSADFEITTGDVPETANRD